MSRLHQCFAELKRDQRRALLPYITGGYPGVATTVEILAGVDPQRCACVEIGIPFSDPIADGPVIQASFSHALDAGFKLATLFDAIAEARDQIAVPVLAMVSYSIVYRRGVGRFVEYATRSGVDGLIVPDLALEEAGELAELGRQVGCPLVLLAAPTSDEQRRRQIGELSEPFVYYQALAGVTGERRALPADLAEQVRSLRSATGKPICVGFGISTAEHVAEVCQVADGAIVGSAIVRRMLAAGSGGGGGDSHEVVRAALEFISELAEPLG